MLLDITSFFVNQISTHTLSYLAVGYPIYIYIKKKHDNIIIYGGICYVYIYIYISLYIYHYLAIPSRLMLFFESDLDLGDSTREPLGPLNESKRMVPTVER
jgi:hypothetical protein